MQISFTSKLELKVDLNCIDFELWFIRIKSLRPKLMTESKNPSSITLFTKNKTIMEYFFGNLIEVLI